jgi:hypothetical protein
VLGESREQCLGVSSPALWRNCYASDKFPHLSSQKICNHGRRRRTLPLIHGHLMIRLNEARKAKIRQQNLGRIYAAGSHLLTFGQYVIDGALASAFVQNSSYPKVIGLCGIVVLVSSLIKSALPSGGQGHRSLAKDEGTIRRLFGTPKIVWR